MKKRNLMTVLALTLSVAFAATGAVAYYNSHTNLKENRFNLVKGERNVTKGEILEENFDPETAKNLAPTMTFAKDPRIKSGVDYDTYAFMKVEMPQTFGSLELDDEYEYLDALSLTINDGWTYVADKSSGGSGDHIYLYMYGADLNTPTTLPAQSTTTALFNTVTVPDFVRTTALNASLDVEGFMEQKEGVSLATAIADAKYWANVED